jgi:hypothetical protein
MLDVGAIGSLAGTGRATRSQATGSRSQPGALPAGWQKRWCRDTFNS